LVQNALDAGVQFVAMRQELVEVDLAEDGAQRRLGELLGLPIVILYADNSLRGVQNLPVDDGIYLQGDVIASDDVLGRDLQGLLAEIDAHHLLDRSKNKDQSRSAIGRAQSSQAEQHSALVLTQDLDAVEQIKDQDDDNYQKSYSRHNASRLRKIVS